jgi:prolyl-tRNA synthetase
LPITRNAWSEDFSRWFRDVIDRAGILDYRYPLKGCGVWLGYGFKLRQRVLTIIRERLDTTGHEEMLFPTLIPEDLIAKESTHIRSFAGETYWVTHGGDTPLNVRLVLRPTSETTITPMMKLWVRSHADLPRKVYQIGSIFRYETKATRPLIRVREVSTFKEAHTFHADHDDAVRQVDTANALYTQIFDRLCLPYLISPRPAWDRFAGALTTYAFDTVLPDGRSLQIGTTHDLGQNFAQAFAFTYETPTGGRDHPWQTSYGISERAIAAVIALHGDDRGLVLPPEIAPTQVVIVPILYRGSEAQVAPTCAAVTAQLGDAGLRVTLDDRAAITPGAKYFEWELRGVPLRVEIGPRDVAQDAVTLVRRDTLAKTSCPQAQLIEQVHALLAEVTTQLRQRARAWLQTRVHRVTSVDAAKAIVDAGRGVAELPWCGRDDCGRTLEQQIDARVLGTTTPPDTAPIGPCAVCQQPGQAIVRVARAY